MFLLTIANSRKLNFKNKKKSFIELLTIISIKFCSNNLFQVIRTIFGVFPFINIFKIKNKFLLSSFSMRTSHECSAWKK